MAVNTVFGKLAPEEVEILDQELEARVGEPLFIKLSKLFRDQSITKCGTGTEGGVNGVSKAEVEIIKKIENLTKESPAVGDGEGESGKELFLWCQSFIRDVQSVQQEMEAEAEQAEVISTGFFTFSTPNLSLINPVYT